MSLPTLDAQSPLRRESAPFRRRVLFVVGVVLAAAFFYFTAQLWLVFFASMLGAVGISTCSRWLARAFRIPRALGFLFLIFILVGGTVLAVWKAYPLVASEVRSFIDAWPQMLAQFRLSWLGRHLTRNGDEVNLLSVVQSVGVPMVGTAFTVFSALTLFGVGIVVALFLGFDPATYRDGLVRAFPRARRNDVRSFLDALNHALERWLLGQAVAMVAIATVMVAALSALGVSYPITLGLLAGLCQFIPYLGPMLWVIPASIVGFSHSTTEGLLVLLVYAAVQAFEGNLLTPMIQRQAVELPPVYTIFGTMIAGLLFGPLGFMLATPLLVVCLVTYDHFWLERLEETR